MNLETCPRCGQNSEGPYETVGTRKYFLCSHCGIEWVTNLSRNVLLETENTNQKSISAQEEIVEDELEKENGDIESRYQTSLFEREEIVEEELDDDLSDEIEEDPDDLFVQAQYYANDSVSKFLKKIIKKFDYYNLDPDGLIALCQFYRITSDFKNYKVEGYLTLSIKCNESQRNYRFQEIIIDSDGLRLNKGGYVTDEVNGGDSYSEEIFPTYDEFEVLDTVIVIDNFLDEFMDNLLSENRELEACDCTDEINKID